MDVRSSTGEKFVLERAVNRGGEAQIWTIQQDPHLVAKLYHKPTAEHKTKLAAMIATPLSRSGSHPTVAWPLQVLYQKERFVGYLMPRAASSLPLFHYYNPARRRRLGLPHAWPRFLHRTAQNLAAAVELVHAHGHIIGDLNESNVLVTQTALVTLVDTDSFQIRYGTTTPRPQNWLGVSPSLQLYRCGVGKAEYTPPELQGVDFKGVDRTSQHDNFALAILIFNLLMDGFHPFAGVLTTPASVGRVDLYGIKHGLFPYLHRGPDGSNSGQNNGPLVVQPPPNAPAFAQLYPSLQEAFRRTFADGHAHPERRVSAKEWKKILHEAEAALVNCPQNATHLYSRHLHHCPTCPPPAVSTIPPQKVMQTAATVFAKVSSAASFPAQPLPTIARASPWLVMGQLVNRMSQLQQPVSRLQLAIQQMPTNWQSYVHGAQASWTELSARYRMVQRATVAHAGLLGSWMLGNLVGFPLAILLIVMVYPQLPLLAPMMPHAAHTQAMLMGLLFATLLGSSQSYVLRRFLLPRSYLRYAWIGVAALAGTLFGMLSFQWLGPAWLQVSVWHTQPLVVTILAACFGATLGFLQSLLLRQQLRLADDGRIWAMSNGISGLLSAQGWFWGQSLGYVWQQADFPDWQINGVIGTLIGVGIGSLLSGGVLLWMMQGPRRSFYLHRFALDLLRWSLTPGRLRQGAIRWGRALLLLILVLCFLQIISQLHGSAALVAPPLPTEIAPHIAPLS